MAMIVLNYLLAQQIDKSEDRKTKKSLLVLSLLISLAPLMYLKYSGLLLSTFNDFFHTRFTVSSLFLPIGISFYTFQSISYTVDLYKSKIQNSKSFIDYAFYMTFFPHLVAGPIVRAKDFMPQIDAPIEMKREDVNRALFRILIGLGKKLILADFLAKYVDMVHVDPTLYSGMENLISMYAYSFQIYFDFSGYSDIAIGIALLMGYTLNENFENPYHSKNITTFWRKWHISLSSWLRDYIYIPLGGNKRGVLYTYLFLMVTMLIGGLWHGASWKFLLWGGLHGLFLAIHKLYLTYNNRIKSPTTKVYSLLSIIITFNAVSILWILFRAVNLNSAISSVHQITSEFRFTDIVPFYYDRTEFVFMLLFAGIVVFSPVVIKNKIQHFFSQIHWAVLLLLTIIILQIILQVKTHEIQPFIYFQF